jgi:hypothetical protein
MAPFPDSYEPTEHRLYARAVADTLRPNDTQQFGLFARRFLPADRQGNVDSSGLLYRGHRITWVHLTTER